MEDTREEELAMEYTFDQVADLLDEMAETFPPVFFEQLNGGILLQEEFTHHVESLANAHGLDDKDEEELLRLLEKYRDAP